MSAKHTSGPWEARHNSASTEDTYCIEIAPAGHWSNLAYLQSWERDGEMGSRAETAANARLIAAAPDLLAACEAAEAALVDLGACRDAACGSCERVLTQVRAAIARATEGDDAA